jgi:hypothetical protein
MTIDDGEVTITYRNHGATYTATFPAYHLDDFSENLTSFIRGCGFSGKTVIEWRYEEEDNETKKAD